MNRKIIILYATIMCLCVKAQISETSIDLNSSSQYGGDYPTDNNNYSNVLSIGGIGAERGLKIYKQNSGNSPTFIGPYNYNDTYVFEMTDGNDNYPDGGIIFGATGTDDIFSSILTIRGNNRVGIGTTNPINLLHLSGSSNGTNINLLRLSNLAGQTTGTEVGIYFSPTNTVTGRGAKITGYQAGNNQIGLKFYVGAASDAATEAMYINSSGNIGIGTTNTFGYKLAVNGTIGAREVKVETTSAWPDYVFSPNHNLRTLEETEQFISQNGHLPDIPSAKQVAAEGLSLGDMDAKLLQKIEELTLYMIEMKKDNDDKDLKLEMLMEKNELLEKKIIDIENYTTK